MERTRRGGFRRRSAWKDAGPGPRVPAAGMRRRIACLALGALVFPAEAPAWQMPTTLAPDGFLSANVERFAEDLAAGSAGRIRISVRSGEASPEAAGIEEAVRSGEAPIGEFPLSHFAGKHPIFGVDSIPFLATSHAKAARLWEASRAATERRLRERNLVLLFAVPLPPPGLFARRPLRDGADLQGLELRVRHPSEERLARLLGATPVRPGPGDLPAAFAEGRVQALFLTPGAALESGLWRSARYYYPVQAWLTKSVVVLGADLYEGLDPALREALREAARLAEERGWRMSRHATRRQLERMAERGLPPSKLPRGLRADLAALGRRMTVEWTVHSGDEGVAVIEAFHTRR